MGNTVLQGLGLPLKISEFTTIIEENEGNMVKNAANKKRCPGMSVPS